MGVHSNITPRNYAQRGCAALFAATRPHNWRYVQVPAVRVRCRAPCKVRLAPHLSKRALRARKERSVRACRCRAFFERGRIAWRLLFGPKGTQEQAGGQEKTSLRRRLKLAQRRGRRDDGNALVDGQREQIEIAGDDEVGACGERARKDVIIVGIARDAWYVDGLDELDRFEVVDKDLRRSLADRGEALGEGRTAGDVGELLEQRGAAVELQAVLPADRL